MRGAADSSIPIAPVSLRNFHGMGGNSQFPARLTIQLKLILDPPLLSTGGERRIRQFPASSIFAKLPGNPPPLPYDITGPKLRPNNMYGAVILQIQLVCITRDYIFNSVGHIVGLGMCSVAAPRNVKFKNYFPIRTIHFKNWST